MSAPSQVIESPHSVDIPVSDIPSWVFSAGTPSTRMSPQYFNADNPKECFSLSEAELYVKRVARGLQMLGLRPDDKVMLYSPNQLFVPILLWGVIAARCVFTAISPTASKTELSYQLRDSNAKILLVHPSRAALSLETAQSVGLPLSSVFLFVSPGGHHDSPPQGLKTWTDFWAPSTEAKIWQWHQITSRAEAKRVTAIINYSSGTTGTPKGVELSHYNVIANSMQIIHKRSLVASTPEGYARKARIDTSGERWIAPLPMYHAFGQIWYCMNAAQLGAKVFIMSRFEIEEFLRYLDIYRITFATVVPVIINKMIKYPHPEAFNLKALEGVVSGSAPLSPEMAHKLKSLYLSEHASVKQGMGLTETTCSLFQFAQDDEDDGRSIGWLNANCKAKIVPVDGEDYDGTAPRNTTVGEIWVSGPNLMKGYYRKPEATAAAMTCEDGQTWFRTGDVGYVDWRGRFYIVDRLKELLKVKGLQVSPAELEIALLQHPDVIDAAVVGAKLNGGEYPRAFVVRKEEKVEEKEIRDLIKSRFAAHKWLTGGVFFVDVIPRTPSGKIMRRLLPKGEAKESKL